MFLHLLPNNKNTIEAIQRAVTALIRWMFLFANYIERIISIYTSRCYPKQYIVSMTHI